MVGSTLKRRTEENASGNTDQVQVKKLKVPSNEAATKRAVLGELQNSRPFAANKEEATGLVPGGSKSSSSKPLAGIEDIDANDKENLMLVSEYVNDIYDHLYKLEIEQPIRKDHLAGQKDVTHKMRAVLVDWINEVHSEFHLADETFQLAVAIIDRYLQVVKNTKRGNLQLVGVTAFLIAAKYEEELPPSIEDLVFFTDDTYSARQIRLMELQIFRAIDYNLSRPLPIHFLRRYSKAAGTEDEHQAMAKYFVELASMDYDLASYKPSEIAAASLFLSLHLLNGNHRASTGFNDQHWTPTLAHYSRYTATHLRPITRQIAKMVRDAPQAKLKAIHDKYQGKSCQKISLRRRAERPPDGLHCGPDPKAVGCPQEHSKYVVLIFKFVAYCFIFVPLFIRFVFVK